MNLCFLTLKYVNLLEHFSSEVNVLKYTAYSFIHSFMHTKIHVECRHGSRCRHIAVTKQSLHFSGGESKQNSIWHEIAADKIKQGGGNRDYGMEERRRKLFYRGSWESSF